MVRGRSCDEPPPYQACAGWGLLLQDYDAEVFRMVDRDGFACADFRVAIHLVFGFSDSHHVGLAASAQHRVLAVEVESISVRDRIEFKPRGLFDATPKRTSTFFV